MIRAQTGVAFEALAIGAPVGQVGTLTVEVYDPSTGATLLAPTTAGITEPRPGTYRTILTAATAGTYSVRWALPSGAVAEEELVVSAFPVSDPPTGIRPTVDEVAALERTRTIGEGSEDEGTFNDNTHPTAAEVEALIDQAVDAVLNQLPVAISETYYPQTRHAITLYTAILVEGSYHREQISEGSVALWRALMENTIVRLQATLDVEGAGAGAGARRVDSVIARTVMADYDLAYLPPPRVELP